MTASSYYHIRGEVQMHTLEYVRSVFEFQIECDASECQYQSRDLQRYQERYF